MNSKPSAIITELKDVAPSLVIFDKDGTLIDFHAMWGAWVKELAQRLASAVTTPMGEPLTASFFDLIGFDASTNHITLDGILAVAPQEGFQQETSQFLVTMGFSRSEAEKAVHTAWFSPDPVSLTKPLADLTMLFKAIQAIGSKVAIATSDDRAGTEETVARLNIAELVDGIICADDGLAIKPEPDMIQHLCHQLNVPPDQCVMVGDNAVDLQMGRAANVGMTIGVLSGLGSNADLKPYADLLLPSVASLLTSQ